MSRRNESGVGTPIGSIVYVLVASDILGVRP